MNGSMIGVEGKELVGGEGGGLSYKWEGGIGGGAVNRRLRRARPIKIEKFAFVESR